MMNSRGNSNSIFAHCFYNIYFVMINYDISVWFGFMERITGTIATITFHNEDNGFSVFKLEDTTAVVGVFPRLNEGETLELEGEWFTHPKFGRQFKAQSFSIKQPDSKVGITKYLASGLVRGIGKVTAEQIVAKFGERTLDILDNNIDRLTELPGIGEKRVETIKKSWSQQKNLRNIMIFLQGYGITPTMAMKIYKKYGEGTIETVKEDPYQLVYDIRGIGFRSADEIGEKMGFRHDDPARIKAGIVYALYESTASGHTYLPEEHLRDQVKQLLDIEISYRDPLLEELEAMERIYIEDGRIYPTQFYLAERAIEQRISHLLQSPHEIPKYQSEQFTFADVDYSEEQIAAMRKSIENKLLILTGGPGTGKTTTLKGIIKIYDELEKKIMLAAPTGRAAKRMTETIGLTAKTIHRLLEYNPSTNEFSHRIGNPLECDLLVVDEMSMIDTLLMQTLLNAVKDTATVLMVGDVDQLPSVGAGNVLRDLIDSGQIPVVTLTKIFRQAEQSKIVVTAHEINKGSLKSIENERESDLFFIEEPDDQNVPELILDLYQNRLPATYGFDPQNDIQVLTPMYKTIIGADNLNGLLQERTNPGKSVITKGSRKYKIGDKVMQLRNNYDKDIYNGDIGFILGADTDKSVLNISFGEKVVAYEFNDLDDLTLAYAITVHKSQGSEYPCVIMPVSTAHYIMLQRNLIYTAITRASKLMVMIGTKKALNIAVNNNKVVNRYTTLFKDVFSKGYHYISDR